jgi:hypothetical protein
MTAKEQIDAEEEIAALIYKEQDSVVAALRLVEIEAGRLFGEEDCARLGRDILQQILVRFQPDLFNEDGTYKDDQPPRM